MTVPSKRSSGILMYRRRHGEVEVLLVHPGGPFWKNKDEGVWCIPKGLSEDDEDASLAARREFEEETGSRADGDLVGLGSFRQPSGKVVTAFALGVGLSMGGNVVIETVFSWPGIGRLLVQAVSVHDYPLAQGAFLMIALVLALMNFVADLLYMVLDPRVSHGRKN